MDTITACYESVEDGQRSKAVLIPRIRGIEDSSRNWSLGMTVHHLVITTNGMVEIVEALLAGKNFARAVRIEDVKPSAQYPTDVLGSLLSAVDRLCVLIRSDKNFKTNGTHRHPWFGEFNGKQWLYLAAFHLRIHRKQMQEIIRRLPK